MHEDFKKKRDSNDFFNIYCFLILMVLWIVLLVFSKSSTIDLILSDFIICGIILGVYFLIKFLFFMKLAKNEKALTKFSKILFLSGITVICLLVSAFFAKNEDNSFNFSKWTEYFTIIVFPAFFGAFKAFTKDCLMNPEERMKHRKEVESIEREAAKMPD